MGFAPASSLIYSEFFNNSCPCCGIRILSGLAQNCQNQKNYLENRKGTESFYGGCKNAKTFVIFHKNYPLQQTNQKWCSANIFSSFNNKFAVATFSLKEYFESNLFTKWKKVDFSWKPFSWLGSDVEKPPKKICWLVLSNPVLETSAQLKSF